MFRIILLGLSLINLSRPNEVTILFPDITQEIKIPSKAITIPVHGAYVEVPPGAVLDDKTWPKDKSSTDTTSRYAIDHLKIEIESGADGEFDMPKPELVPDIKTICPAFELRPDPQTVGVLTLTKGKLTAEKLPPGGPISRRRAIVTLKQAGSSIVLKGVKSDRSVRRLTLRAGTEITFANQPVRPGGHVMPDDRGHWHAYYVRLAKNGDEVARQCGPPLPVTEGGVQTTIACSPTGYP